MRFSDDVKARPRELRVVTRIIGEEYNGRSLALFNFLHSPVIFSLMNEADYEETALACVITVQMLGYEGRER